MNSDNIIISIIIPCYNDGRFLPEAVQSVEKNQTGRHEIIIVNDGSNDPATLDVLAAIEKRGHRVLHQQNLGLGAARNRGVAQARGRYILTLDADNRIRPAYIDRGIEILDREPAIDVVYGDSENFGDQIGRNRVADFNFDRLLAWNFIDACAVFRKQAWERCGGYDEHMPHQGFEDWDFWCRIACSGGGFVHVDEVLYDYRKRKDSMSSQMDTPVRMTAILDHMRAKKIEATVEDYLAAYQSWDFFVETFRRHPLRMLAKLLLRVYFPGWYFKKHPPIDARHPLKTTRTS
jgi:glycosyltransferase involved in cell wall biosynthesis